MDNEFCAGRLSDRQGGSAEVVVGGATQGYGPWQVKRAQVRGPLAVSQVCGSEVGTTAYPASSALSRPCLSSRPFRYHWLLARHGRACSRSFKSHLYSTVLPWSWLTLVLPLVSRHDFDLPNSTIAITDSSGQSLLKYNHYPINCYPLNKPS